MRTGRRDRTPWQDHLAYLEALERVLSRHTGPVIVLGDFNQYVPNRRAPPEVERALSCALGDKLMIATGGELEPLGYTVIDHVACDSGLQLRFRTILSNRSVGGEPLSDHYGVVTSFVSTEVAEAASAALVQPRRGEGPATQSVYLEPAWQSPRSGSAA